MDIPFLQQFLLISDIRTILFLILLAAGFYLIHILYHKKHLDFSVVVLIGTGLGLLLGLAVQAASGFPDQPEDIRFIREATAWYQLFGTGYMNLIKVIVVPLVIISILQVIISLEQGHQMGSLIRKTLSVTLVMAAVSAVTGLVIGLLFGLGQDSVSSGASGSQGISGAVSAAELSDVPATLKNLIPDNIVSAMVNNNIIGLVIFSSILGLALWWVNKEHSAEAEPLYRGIRGLHRTMINMALLILDYMPFAVLALLANTIARRGLSGIFDAGKFIFALYLGTGVQFFIQLAALLLNGLNPVPYLKKSAAPLLLAFTSRSSVGCLPLTVETLTKDLGVSEATANFVAGFGTTAGMQGCAGLFPALLIVYVCNITGTPIDLSMLVMAVIVVTIGSLGIAGIPGTASMAASVSLSGVGLASAFSTISPILAIDPIIDMPRTLLNVSGSLTNALIVDKRLGLLDESVYK
ncbi:cation:dicarboxylate symporter family transporter [Diplocloster agilis]|uniref:L-cystine uptake protein TcyP n=1 Tax=Diplocloster agilis TaxID=2850323 RepID=A0A949K1D3_9FIRM|nr:cation:dicarboxylase symporter family transporter [Diplocloster agilis]MBU9739133.1 cation:dicarboxylase symporter family transporter [Diplocloster agilis]MBU9746214.1 cation:dicarboxylase symporter family transporter [Diplocloster agilis]